MSSRLDGAMFWLTACGIVAAIAAVSTVAAIAESDGTGRPVLDYGLGWLSVALWAVAIALALWALVLYLAHQHAQGHAEVSHTPPQPSPPPPQQQATTIVNFHVHGGGAFTGPLISTDALDTITLPRGTLDSVLAGKVVVAGVTGVLGAVTRPTEFVGAGSVTVPPVQVAEVGEVTPPVGDVVARGEFEVVRVEAGHATASATAHDATVKAVDGPSSPVAQPSPRTPTRGRRHPPAQE